MYDFQYNYMMKNLRGSKILFTDTDSLCYSIPSEEDIYINMQGNEWFDFSNLPKDHPNYDITNIIVPGKFKDECPIIQSWILQDLELNCMQC